MIPRVIAMFGAAGAGKDTAADHLVAKHGAFKTGVAVPLKELCCRLFGWEAARLQELEYKETPSGHEWRPFRIEEILTDQGILPTAENRVHLQDVLAQCTPDRTRREILQLVGTEGFRAIDPDHWIKRAVLKVRDLANTGQPVVVTDCRFRNEFAAFRSAFGAALVRVDNLGGPGTEHLDHASEQEWRAVEPDLILAADHGQIDHLLLLADSMLLQHLPAAGWGTSFTWCSP